MKALVYTDTKTLELREVAIPKPQKGEALVKIEASGICGSDMHAWAGHDERRPAPLILGHEAAGVVESGTLKGKRVTVNPLVSCDMCDACKKGRDNLCPDRQIISMPPREGAFAEYIVIPEGNLTEVPDNVPLEKAALAEPLACGWHAVRLGDNALDTALSASRALVLGGGAIGLGAALSLTAQGCKNISILEPNPVRFELLSSATDYTIVKDATEIRGPIDIVIDGVGFEASRRTASKTVRPGGVIAHIGLGHNEGGLDIRRITLQEITFIGTYTYTKKDFHDAAQAIFDGRLGSLDWPEVRSLKEGAKAFNDIALGKVASPKIILKTG